MPITNEAWFDGEKGVPVGFFWLVSHATAI